MTSTVTADRDHGGDRDAAVVYCPVDRWRVLTGPTYICPDCRDHLSADLTEITRRYPLLDARPEPEDADAIRALLRAARREVATWN